MRKNSSPRSEGMALFRLMLEAHIAVSPGIGFGANGDGHVRLALVENEQRIRQAARNVRSFLQRDMKAAS